MNKTFTTVLIIAIAYFAGAKFPGLARRIGVA